MLESLVCSLIKQLDPAHLTQFLTFQVYISFIDNFAGNDGAAIYATDIAGCTRRRQTLKKDNNNPNYYNDSIFKEEPPFYFRYLAMTTMK